MKKFLIVFLCACIIFPLASCAPKPKNKMSEGFVNPETARVTQNIAVNSESQQHEADKIEFIVEDIEKKNSEIFNHVASVQEKVTDEEVKLELTQTKSLLRVITEYFPVISKSLDQIKSTAETNIEIGKNTVKLEKTIRELESAKLQSENEAIKKLYANMNWIFGFGFLSLIGGAFVFMWDKRMGMTILTIGLLTLAFSAAAIYYLKWVATIGIIILLLGCGLCVLLVGYAIIKANKEKVVYKTAITENVKIIEELKKLLTQKEFEDVFGDHEDSVVNQIQSPETKSLSDSIRVSEGLTAPGLTAPSGK